MGTFSNSGYIRDRLDIWQTRIKELYYSIFGNNIDLSDDTQDGQLAGALAEAMSNQDQQTEDMAGIVDPDKAAGNNLAGLVKLNGITINGASRSIASVRLYGTDSTVVIAGSVVKDTQFGEEFTTDSEAIIIAPYTTVTVTAVNTGPVVATAGTLTIIDSQVAGWTSVTNPNDATVGQSVESDPDLRVRRNSSVAIASTGNQASVSGALKSLDDVVNAIVKENKLGAPDADGVAAHAISCVVLGGDDDEIANTIWQKTSAGCTLHKEGTGGTTVTIQDADNFDQDINFNRPPDVDIYVSATVNALAGYPTDGDDLMKQAIVDYFETDDATRLLIGEDVIYSEVYNPVNTIPGASITALTIGIAPAPVGVVDISIDYNELARFATTRIVIT